MVFSLPTPRRGGGSHRSKEDKHCAGPLEARLDGFGPDTGSLYDDKEI